MNEWYSAKELAGLPGMPGTERSVYRKALTELWQFREVPASGGPGGKRREYHLSALPEETRMALITESAGISTSAPSTDTLQEYLISRRITLSPKDLADPKMQAKIACARAYEACPPYMGRERLLDTLAKQYSKSKPQIRRWIADIDSLRTQTTPRITIGTEKVDIPDSYAFTPEALACGLSRYANDTKAGVKAAYRQMADIATGKGWSLGDYSSFTRIVKKIPPSIWLRINKGATGFELYGLPKIIRQWTAIPVQSVLCGDQKIFDYVTWNPETDEPVLPEGYFWMDCASRMITGFSPELGHYNQFTVGNSLREALRYGIPDEIYTDWGKPEGAKHITHIRQGLSGLSATGDFIAMSDKYGDVTDDTVEHRKAQPGKPWMKPIENIMNLIEMRLRAKNLPGYRKREKEDAWMNKETQDLLKAQAKRGQLMTIEEFIGIVYETIDEHNRAEKQLKEGGSLVPLTFFKAGLMRQGRYALKDHTLDYICLPTFERKPHQSVVMVTVRSNDHRSYHSPILSGRTERVRISVDPYDREAPAVLTDCGGNYLGLAEAWNVQHPADSDGIAKKRESQRRIMKWVNEQSRRVRTGFELYAPEVKEKEIVKITPATATARAAEQAKKVYQLHKVEQKEETERVKDMAIQEQKNLIREFSSIAATETDPWALPEGRDKYAYWLKIKQSVDANMPLTQVELDFYTRYPNTADYRTCHGLFEDYGEIYLGGAL